MIEYFKRTIRDELIKSISGLEIGSWINVTDPSPEEVDFLVDEFGLDKRNLESGLDQNEIPHIDFVDEDTYFFAKNIPDRKKGKIETYLIVISKKFILTLSESGADFVDDIITGKVDFFTTQKLKCLIRLFSLMNESFEELTVKVVKRVQTEKKSFADLKEKQINSLLEQEDTLNSLVSSYYYMNLLYERAASKVKFFEQDREIIEDLTTEATQGLNICRSSLKSISNIRSYYDIFLSNKLNKIINVLTIFTIIISIPSAISGLYGMNVILPFAENPLVFYYLIVLIIVIWLGFILYLKRKKIL